MKMSLVLFWIRSEHLLIVLLLSVNWWKAQLQTPKFRPLSMQNRWNHYSLWHRRKVSLPWGKAKLSCLLGWRVKDCNLGLHRLRMAVVKPSFTCYLFKACCWRGIRNSTKTCTVSKVATISGSESRTSLSSELDRHSGTSGRPRALTWPTIVSSTQSHVRESRRRFFRSLQKEDTRDVFR